MTLSSAINPERYQLRTAKTLLQLLLVQTGMSWCLLMKVRQGPLWDLVDDNSFAQMAERYS